jgi:large subunit ribosomal protein L1
MKKHGKRIAARRGLRRHQALYDAIEAVALVKKNANAKFNETIEIHVRLGVDPKKSDQNVRGTVSLPHGTGRTVRVIAFARGDKLREAKPPAPISSAKTT